MQAHFVFYQEGLSRKGVSAEPYYNIRENGRTVSQKTLHKIGVAIPLTPDFETWDKLVKTGQRCKNCWSITGQCIHALKQPLKPKPSHYDILDEGQAEQELKKIRSR